MVIFFQQFVLNVNGETPKECTATVGQQNQFNNAVQFKGHLAWKWNGTKTQLEEQPQKEQKWDIVFTQVEPQEQTRASLA